MNEKRCPKCKLYNPENAQRCDCGYDFEMQKMESTFLTEEQQKFRESASAGEIALSFLLPLVGFIYGVVLLSKGKKKGSQIISAALVAVVVITLLGIL